MITTTVQPKVTDLRSAQAEIVDFANNPPKTPEAMALRMADIMGVNSVLTGALSSIVPGASFLISGLSSIFGAFSSGPSLGELTLKGIAQLSTQIAETAKYLEKALSEKIDASAFKVIESTLQGVDELQKEVSAANVIENYNVAKYADELRARKTEAYAVFLQDIQTLRQDALSKLTANYEAFRRKVDAQYMQALNAIASLLLQLAPDMANALQSAIDKQTGSGYATRSINQGQATQKDDKSGLMLIGLAALGIYAVSKSKKN